jgi:hypothetical protein
MGKTFLPLVFILLFFAASAQKGAQLSFTNNRELSLGYNGVQLLTATATTNNKPYRLQHTQKVINGALHQIITITAGDFKSFELNGTIAASSESIACESEQRDGGLKFVRHSFGPSYNLRNHAVYDRQGDWLLSFDAFNPKVKITPVANNRFEINVKGWEIVIRFRPEYYKKHRGLSYFNPRQYSVWKQPVSGWCSWFAYFDKVKEEDVKEVSDVLSEKLKPYGLQYIQMDDGYQQVPIGLPDTWLQPNKKFPSGLTSLATYIKSKGFIPGIWTNVSFADSAGAHNNKQYFVKDKNNNPALGNWVGYVMDGSNPKTIQELISPVYSGLKNDGWQYFKLDALRHLKYEGYNSYADYFSKKGYDRNEAFCNVVKEVRKQIGKESFLLACWGIRPELVGIADGCRIGNDGFSYAGLAQFNSYNNIIWRNDPDHIVLSPKEAFRSCVATSLTGSLFMLTDKPGKYRDEKLLEAPRRTLPVLFTLPGQVYDVDASVSSNIALADIELSGSGPRPFDASTSTTTGLFALEISKPFENWMILGRLDERDKVLPSAELGLDANKEYIVFEFWTKQLQGTFQKQFAPPLIDTNYNCQVFCIREKQNHPQVLATNRHITCGAVDLNNVQWKSLQLSGESETVKNENYLLYIYEPDGFTYEKILLSSGSLISAEKKGMMRVFTLQPGSSAVINWQVRYK